MNKIANSFQEHYDEIKPAQAQPIMFPRDPNIFNMGTGIGALVGAITGAAFANKKNRENLIAQRKEEQNKNNNGLNGNYYHQVQNVVENLKVIFTPLGVVFTVKNGPKESTIETIETSEMTEDMYHAWQRKDYDYYKHTLLNKMYSEVQFVEQAFAKKLIEKHTDFKNSLSKHASENDDNIDFDDITDVELLEHVAEIKEFYEKQTPLTEKMATVLVNSFDNDEYEISLKLDRPFDKYAGIADKLSFLGLQLNSKDIRSEQGNYLNPHYLSNKVKIGFLPDRVLFIVDNKLISTLPAINMNEEGFENFEKQDQNYFINHFKKEAKKGVARIQGKLPSNSPLMQQEKVASSGDISEIFYKSDIHPVVYLLALNQKYGDGWINFDGFSLIKAIETDFKLDIPIDDVPLNKILSVKAANASNNIVLSNFHTFEKVIRSFSDKPIDFFQREISDMDIEDVAFGLDVLDRVTLYEDIYSYISADVFYHIVSMLAQKENFVYYPSEITGSKSESEFNKMINDSLIEEIDKKTTEYSDEGQTKEETIKLNKYIRDIITKILRDMDLNGNYIIGTRIKDLSCSDNIKNIIENQLAKNIALDHYLLHKQDLLNKQVEQYGIKGE